MEKSELVRVVRRWWWLFILATVVAGSSAYLVGREQPDVYEASARLLIGPGVDSLNPDLNDLRAGGQLLRTYAEFPTTYPFLLSIIDELDLTVSPSTLRGMLDIRSSEETQILNIIVRAPDRNDAIEIANAVAESLVEISPSGREGATTNLYEQMRNQASRLQESVPVLEESIVELEAQLERAGDVETQRLVAERLDREWGRLSDTNSTLAALYEALQDTRTNQVQIIEPANTAVPVLSLLWLKVVVGMMTGVVLSVVLVLSYEYLSDNVDKIQELSQFGDVPSLGTIAPYGAGTRMGPEQLVVRKVPESQASEDYRRIAIKLLFAGEEGKHPRSILLSSVDPGVDTGKHAANFAVVLSQTGKRVILVDANLHRPTIGQYFNVLHRPSLTDVLTGEMPALDLAAVDWAPGLLLLPSGSVSYDSFVLLASPRMEELLERLEAQADIVLINGSALTAFADSLFLASRVEGVILHAHAGNTRRKSVVEAISSLRSVDAEVLGVLTQGTRRPARRLAPRLRRPQEQNLVMDEQPDLDQPLRRDVPVV